MSHQEILGGPHATKLPERQKETSELLITPVLPNCRFQIIYHRTGSPDLEHFRIGSEVYERLVSKRETYISKE